MRLLPVKPKVQDLYFKGAIWLELERTPRIPATKGMRYSGWIKPFRAPHTGAGPPREGMVGWRRAWRAFKPYDVKLLGGTCSCPGCPHSRCLVTDC